MDWNYKPAADLGLNPVDSWRSIRREPGLVSIFAQKASHGIINNYLRFAHGIQVHGAVHFPKEPPFIVVANHSSHLDVLALMAALSKSNQQHAFPIAAGDVFFETPTAAAFSAIFLNALPMWRKHCGSHAIKDLRERLLNEPVIYLLFPEGTRARDGVMRPFKSGVGMLAAETNIPVVPCYLQGCYESLPAGSSFPRFSKIHVWTNPQKTFANVPNDREGWRSVANTLQEDIVGMLHRAPHKRPGK